MRRSNAWAARSGLPSKSALERRKIRPRPLFGGLTGKHRDVVDTAAGGRRATTRSHALTMAAIDQLRAAFL